MIQLRNVPDGLHRGLKSRAALAGMSLSDYLLQEIKEIAERPTLAELRERLHRREPVGDLDTARWVQMEREARWQLVRHTLDPQSHEVKEHTEEQDECIPPDPMGPHEARMGRVVFGSTGSVQHQPDVGASEKHEKRTQRRAQ